MRLLDNGKFSTVYGKTLEVFNLINGEELPAADAKRFDSNNPAELQDRVATAPLSGAADVQRAVKAARSAFEKWREVPAPVRAAVIGRFGTLVEQNLESIAYLMTREMGKTLKEARGSVQEAVDTAQFFQSEGRRLYGQTVPSEMRRKELFTYRRPKGVVGVITPSNFPFAVASWKIIPALLCGNTVVWKPSEDAAAVAYIFGKLFQAAGLPNGCLNIVHGFGNPTGQALLDAVDSGDIDKISFTGSTAVGRKVGEVCGRNLIIPSLELGGKNPLIVMEDADLEQAVAGAIWSTYGTAGQRCTSCGNIIVQAQIYDEFKRRFVEKLQAIRIGNPLLHRDVLYGPMICKKYHDTFLEQYAWGEAEAAKLLSGKGRITKQNPWPNFAGDPDTGYYCWPTLWEITVPLKRIHESKLVTQEIFGPTTNLIKVNNIDEALQVANTPDYGLSSAIYTNNRQYIYAFKQRIEAGMSSVNNSTTGAEAHLPFGGIKGSGNGTRESGIWVLEAYSYWHAINEDMSGKLQLAQMDTEHFDTEATELGLEALLPPR